MAKPFPVQIVLKKRKCPRCGDETFGHPDLKPDDIAVQAACKKEGCDFKMDLFWIGDNAGFTN